MYAKLIESSNGGIVGGIEPDVICFFGGTPTNESACVPSGSTPKGAGDCIGWGGTPD